MKTKSSVDLSHFSTLRIGGIAKKFLIPENEKDVMSITKENLHFIIGGGSNLLINDRKEFDTVIYTGKLKEKMAMISEANNVIEVSSGYKLAEIVRFAEKHSLGGIEYLFNVPGTLGGAIYMNAGEGRNGDCIGNYVEEVKVWDGRNLSVIKCKPDDFSYRSSIFQNIEGNFIIVSAKLKLSFRTPEQIKSNIKRKIEIVKKFQDTTKPNLGSVFSENCKYIITLNKKIHYGWKDGVHWSGKSRNWLTNSGKGTFFQAMFLIKISIIIHRLTLKKVRLEWRIWR